MHPESSTHRSKAARWLDRTGQRWKVWSAYVAVAVQASALLVFFFGGEAEHRLLAFSVLGGALLAFAILALSLRCRVCGEFVFIWAWHQRDGFSALAGLEACPQCGARDDRDKLPIGPAPAGDRVGVGGLSFDRVRQPRSLKWLTPVIAVMVGLWLLRWLMDLLR